MDIRIPEIGESIIEAKLAKWHCQDGAQVQKDDLLCELETDKITLELFAETDGVVTLRTEEGETVPIGTVIAVLTEEAGQAQTTEPLEPSEPPPSDTQPAEYPAAGQETAEPEPKPPRPQKQSAVPQTETETEASPEPIEPAIPQPGAPFPNMEEDLGDHDSGDEERLSHREPLSPLRQTVARRLLAARQQTAMATTINEADLSRIMELRSQYGERFMERNGIKLGLMSFFVKACVEALREFPVINARLEEEAIVYQHFYDIGIAVATDQGLVAPVLLNADRLNFADIEKQIAELAEKARKHRLALADLQGGTFSISNGGVYGSLLSTPLLTRRKAPFSACTAFSSARWCATIRSSPGP